jgi:hypothetical protein
VIKGQTTKLNLSKCRATEINIDHLVGWERAPTAGDDKQEA